MLTLAEAETIRILVWVLSFMSFGYATGEFEVTSDRLGVYRPEEHIGMLHGAMLITITDSGRQPRKMICEEYLATPKLTSMQKDYADNEDARKHDPRLRGPVTDAELAIDPETGKCLPSSQPWRFDHPRDEELYCQ
jgi:hypothetical protein